MGGALRVVDGAGALCVMEMRRNGERNNASRNETTSTLDILISYANLSPDIA